MRRRFIYSLIIFAVAAFCAGTRASGDTPPSLPEIGGWRCGELMSVPLDAASGNQGFWQERDYRTDGGLPLKAVLMYGTGPKFYNQPPADTSSKNGASTYEIIFVGGYKSSLEYDPALGYSVAVNAFERTFSLTVESGPFVAKGDVISAAERLLEEIYK
jgi:hypothetical protein